MRYLFMFVWALCSFSAHAQDEIRVYFNTPINENIEDAAEVSGNSGSIALSAIIAMINSAENTIDVALYNNDQRSLVDALEDAVDRGVIVRYIGEAKNGNLAIKNRNLNFPYELVDPVDGIMHNKFFIIDADNEDNAWVLTGGMNMTQNQIYNDPNNIMFIQSRDLAIAYTTEFNEMWGGNDLNFNSGRSRIGNTKRDNTAHDFMVGNIKVSCYFSPSDGTTSEIRKALSSANEGIYFGLLLFTENSLGATIANMHSRGIEVAGILEAGDDFGSEYDFLVNQGVDVRIDKSDEIFHHKYAIVDPFQDDSDPILINGSHNWTASAENVNDENTLIFYDGPLARLFFSEFSLHWNGEPINTIDSKPLAYQRYEDKIYFTDDLEELKVYSIDGQLIQYSRQTKFLDLSPFANGVYVLQGQNKGQHYLTKIARNSQ